jgi:hypothetical protein
MRNYEEILKDIHENAKGLLSPEASERSMRRAEGCLQATICEILLDIRESLGKGTIVPSCEVTEE